MKSNMTIYIAKNCPYSKKLIDFFYEKGIPFHKIDISDDHQGAIDLNKLTGDIKTPVIVNNEATGGWKILIGWNKDVKKQIELYSENMLGE